MKLPQQIISHLANCIKVAFVPCVSIFVSRGYANLATSINTMKGMLLMIVATKALTNGDCLMQALKNRSRGFGLGWVVHRFGIEYFLLTDAGEEVVRDIS